MSGLIKVWLAGIDYVSGHFLCRTAERMPFAAFFRSVMENAHTYASQIPLPLPSRYGNTLAEMPHSATNSRDGSKKRILSNLHEPAAKRVTLVERAGEPHRSNLPEPSSTKAATAADVANDALAPLRNFSQSYRSNSGAARTISGSLNSSFASSVGPGIRRPLQTISRPKTSHARQRIDSGADPRPATSMDTRVGRNNEGPSKRMLSLSYTPRMDPPPRPGAVRAPYDATHGDHQNSRNATPGRFRILQSRTTSPPASITHQRNSSLSSVMSRLRLGSISEQSVVSSTTPKHTFTVPLTPTKSPSKLPRLTTPTASFIPPSPSVIPKPRRRSPSKFKQFLTKDSNTEAWNVDEQYSNIEAMHEDIKRMHMTINHAASENSTMKDSLALHKSTIQTLEKDRSSLQESNISLHTEVERTRCNLASVERTNAELKERHEVEIEQIKQQIGKRTQLELEQRLFSLEKAHKEELEHMKNDHQQEVHELKRNADNKIEEERSIHIQVLNQATTAGELHKQQEEIRLRAKDEEIKIMIAETIRLKSALEQESALNAELHKILMATTATGTTLEISRKALEAKIEYLESDSKSQSEAYAAMEKAMNEAIERAECADAEVLKAESQARRYRDTIQQLRGNIQVISRQRPLLEHDESTELAIMSYPDIDQMTTIEVRGPEEKSSLGTDVTKKYPFTFDRTFGQSANNDDIWDEVSRLVQSAIDGYNVCMFAYGQTGSGKTYTMSAQDGVMPRAIRHIYHTTKHLESLGWKYTIQGKFVEVYNENINDLLGDVDLMDQKKHEIKHDMQKGETTITEVTVVDLDSQEMVETIVEQAMARRSVAATKLNERSSRSHSVFILTLSGYNSITGESSKGTLNLVDLAGSERVSRSKVEGDRLKETQNINKSLSSLGDVISALGRKEPGAHIPYRNSKLTHLLQLSLGGNSKTLMFVMVSPLREHLAETLTSLKFATKVHGTHIGTAKKVAK